MTKRASAAAGAGLITLALTATAAPANAQEPPPAIASSTAPSFATHLEGQAGADGIGRRLSRADRSSIPGSSCARNWGPRGAPADSVVIAQEFEEPFQSFDSFAAVDFTLTRACTVGVVRLDARRDPDGAAQAMHLWIYGDDEGRPDDGDVICAETVPDPGPAFRVVLAEPCELAPGTYWLAAQVRQDYDPYGQWFWGTTAHSKGYEDVWKNPGDGYETGCTDWGTFASCLAFEGDYDLRFKARQP